MEEVVEAAVEVRTMMVEVSVEVQAVRVEVPVEALPMVEAQRDLDSNANLVGQLVVLAVPQVAGTQIQEEP